MSTITSLTTLLAPVIAPTTVTSKVDVTTLFSSVTSTITVAPVAATYWTTYVDATPDGTTTLLDTIITLWSTTFIASTFTSIASSPYSTITGTPSYPSFITSISSASSATGNSTSSASTPIDTLHAAPTGLPANKKPIATIIIGAILAAIGAIILLRLAYMWCMLIRPRRARMTLHALAPPQSPRAWVLRQIAKKDKRALDQVLPIPPTQSAPTRPPPPPIPSADVGNGSLGFASPPFPPPPTQPPPAPPTPSADLGNGSFRIASPPRPRRPLSISESVLNVMSMGSELDSNAAVAFSEHLVNPSERAYLRSPVNGFDDDDESGDFIPNTDANSGYDGTRKKYLLTAIEHGMPMTQLTRPSLRARNPARLKATKRTSYTPEPLRIHKRSATDPNHNAKGYSIETAHPSPVPTEQMFTANIRHNLSKTTTPERYSPEHADLMADDSSVDGSYIGRFEKIQKREVALAELEGRAPVVVSSESMVRPREIPDQEIVAKRKANVVDEEVINQWI